MGAETIIDRGVAVDPSVRAPEARVDAPVAERDGRLALAAALAASTALAACGGGSGDGGGNAFFGTGLGAGAGTGAGAGAGAGTGSGGVQAGSLTPIATTPTAQTWLHTEAKSDDEAARFLLQAQFSATEAEIAAVRAKGYLPWLGEQADAPATQTAWQWLNGKDYNTVNVDDMIWRELIKSTDGFRKRMALVFTEIFVVSANELGSSWPHHMMAQYWDTLAAGVTGNFRQLLEAVTLNPAMGFYLNTRGNRKENNSGRQPDENYAREVMQLMTLGLHQLNADGSVRLGADGQPLSSYSQDDVTNLARVFTGYDLDIKDAERNAFTRPDGGKSETNAWTQRRMVVKPADHSLLEAKFLGSTVPSRPATADGAAAALKTALDTLFNHPNVGPFIGKQLIQRLVTSNPSPAYVARVSGVFADNGAGVRGDMKSVFAAVLLDNEARSPAGLSNPDFGRLREPMLRLVQWGRSFGVDSALDTWKIGVTSDPASRLGQSPLRSPSVFNFFRPGYVPPSTVLAREGKAAPEFQLVNETSVGGYLNFMQGVLVNGFASKDVIASYAVEKSLVVDAAALVRRINLVLCANQLSPETLALITSALATPPVTATSSDAIKMNRIHAAVLMVMASSDYLIQK